MLQLLRVTLLHMQFFSQLSKVRTSLMTSDLSNLLHHEDQINVVFYICVLVLGSVDQGETKLVHFIHDLSGRLRGK